MKMWVMIVTEKTAREVKTRSVPFTAVPLSEGLREVEKTAIERVIESRNGVGIVLSRLGYRWAKHRYREITGETALECDFRGPLTLDNIEASTKVVRLAKLFPGDNTAHDIRLGELSIGITQKWRVGIEANSPLVFCTGLSDIGAYEAHGLAALLERTELRIIADWVDPNEIPFSTAQISPSLQWICDNYEREPISARRRQKLDEVLLKLAAEIVWSRVMQINICGSHESDKYLIAGIISRSVQVMAIGDNASNRFAMHKTFEPLDATWEEIEAEQISRTKILIVDEADRIPLELITKLRGTYPRIIFITRQPLEGFPEESRINLDSEMFPR